MGESERRAEILQAARHLALRHGLQAVTMEAIAKEARVAKPTLYKYYGDKSAVFSAIVTELLVELHGRFSAELHHAGNAAERIAAALTAKYAAITDFMAGSPHADELYNETDRLSAPQVKVAEAASDAPLVIAPGVNEFRFAAGDGADRRAEVTVFVKGPSFPALRTDLNAAQRKLLSYEAAPDVFYAPSAGADGKSLLKTRPSESATLEIEITGPVERPVLTLGAAKAVFPVSLREGDRLFCRDGRNWRVIDADRKERAKGVLDVTLAPVSGVVETALSSDAPASAAATLKLVKLYEGN